MKRLIDFSSRFRILKGGKIALVITALLGSVTLSFASPSGGSIVSGSATISQNGTVTNIDQNTAKASINWQTFSVANGETVNFNQPDASSITLNRVVGNEKSVIDGALNANGQVWLLNSNGVLFSKNASINTSGILATTAELSDTDFQNGNYNFKNSSSNSVINQGTINIQNAGSVILASNEVINEGTIKATKGKVHLVGADSYSINLNGNSLVNLRVDKGVLDAMVSNSGNILANGGEIYLTTNAVDELLKGVVNNTGVIEANSVDDLTGHIELFAHGGEVQVGGTIKAEGLGDQDGGFIETSGKDFQVANDVIISTKSENGKTGTWLIDPTDITIVDGGTDGINGSSIDASTIESSLTSTSVVLQADNDITISESINSTTSNSLTFKAARNIVQTANTTITTQNGDVIFWSDSDANSEGRILINEGSNIETNGGDIVLAGGIDSNSDGIPDGYASGYTNRNIGVWLYGASGNYINLSSSGGNIIIKGQSSSILGTNPDYNNQNGILSRYTVLSSGAGNIDLYGISIGDASLTQGILFSSSSSINTSSGDVTLTGIGSSSGANKYWGIRLYDGASITSGGNLVMTGIAGASDREGISQASGTISVAGTTTINAGSYDIDLTSTTNDFTGVVTVTQANDVSIVDVNALILGSISSTGIVDISTLINNLTVSGDISGTTVTLNAGKNTAAGTSTGGDIIISGTPTITATTGNSILYTGSVSGSTGLTSLIGSGSGNFRYNSDETSTNFTTVLGTTGNYAIYREQPTVTITATDDTKTYDGLAYSGGNGVSYLNFLNGDTSTSLSGTLTYSGTSQGAINAGTYVITASGLSDSLGYALSYANGSLTVNKANATVTADSDTTTYNGLSQSVDTFTASGLVNGETISVLDGVTASGSGTNAGTYTTTASGTDENYNITFVDGSLVINPKNLTLNLQGEGSKQYDGTSSITLNGVTPTVDGVIDGDDITVSTGSVTGFADKNAGDNKAVTFTGFSLSGTDIGNYSLVSGSAQSTASISKADATVTADSDITTYNGLSQSVSGFTASGLVNGETISVLDGVTASGSGTNVGTYTTTASGTDENYNLTFVDGSLVINKANATVTADSDTTTYNGLSQSVDTFTASGLVNGETISVLDGVTASGSGTNAGTYTTTASGTDENYNLTFVNGSLVINPKSITVSADDLSKIVGNEDPTLTYIVEGLVGEDILQGLLERASGETVGNYTISQGNLANSNYSITFNNGIFTIERDDTSDLDNVISSITNSVTTPPVVPVIVSTAIPQTSGNSVNLVSRPLESQPTTLVTMSELQASNGNGNGNTPTLNNDIRVPVGDNSIVQLVNGGVNLPNGVEQQFFVVEDEN